LAVGLWRRVQAITALLTVSFQLGFGVERSGRKKKHLGDGMRFEVFVLS
jgi:hypothetical protein